MTARYQYQIKVNDATGSILDACPSEQWSKVAKAYESRGGIRATLNRRLITDTDILPLVDNDPRYIEIEDGMVVCPWEVIAEMVD